MSGIWNAAERWMCAASAGLLLAVTSGCQPPPATTPAPTVGAPTGGLQSTTAVPAADGISQAAPANVATPPVQVAAAANPAPPAEVLPDDPLELARLSVEAHAEKVRLISTVQDLETAKAVSGTFPAIDERHRLLEERLSSRLLTEEVKQQIDQPFKAQRDQLQKDYAREYVRVAFIPGAWEHMHPELTPFADMTVIGQDAASLERAVVRMLTESILLMRQVTDMNKALELSPRYRVATCRIGSVLGRLNVASGGSGIREIQPPQVTALRKQSEEERKRFLSMNGIYHALRFGKIPAAAPASPTVANNADRAAIDRLVVELRSQDRGRIIIALNGLSETTPNPAHEDIATETLRLFAFEPVRGSAVETIKKGWFSPSQIPQIREAMPTLADLGYRYMLAEGISRTPNLDVEDIEFLATLFDEEPGKAVSVLRIVGPAAETVAHKYASSPKVEVRKCVCELLKDIGGEASLPVLQKLTEDPDEGVASKASEAIREIGKPVDQRPHGIGSRSRRWRSSRSSRRAGR